MSKKLLLIEDEEFISYIYKRQLEIAGFAVDTARDGITGLSAIQKNDYDLVLLDIMLPGMNGIDILKAVKNDEKTKQIPVIMVTNLAQDEFIQQALKLGAAAYWIKANFSPSEIVLELNKFFKTENQ